jgi:uncharacterized membrane protein YkvA (DUF1232 family)
MALRRRQVPWERATRFNFRTLAAAIRDRRTPWRAKLLTVAVIAYALWPFDLVPDFAPVVGWIDDLIIVPAGLWLAYRMIPGEVVEDARRASEAQSDARQK